MSIGKLLFLILQHQSWAPLRNKEPHICEKGGYLGAQSLLEDSITKLSVTITELQRKSTKKDERFIIVLEISVYGPFVLVLWASEDAR